MQRLAVALLMATLLGPMGGGLAGHHMGMGIDAGKAAPPMDLGGVVGQAVLPMDMGDGHAGHHAADGEQAANHQMGGNDCAEHDSGESHRCAGLWSTACCDYFAPAAKIKIEPPLDSRTHASDALPVGAVAYVVEPAATRGHLILPIAGEGRAGSTSLVILHSSLLL